MTEIETMASAGQLDRLMFVRDEDDAHQEVEGLADYLVLGMKDEAATRAEHKALVRVGQERIMRAVGKQRMIRGGREEQR